MGRILLSILCLVIFASNLWAAERLLYAIRHESLQRYPDIVNTKIYSLDPDGKESHLVFSDENATIMLLARRGMPGHPGEVLTSSKTKIFAHAVEKRLNPGRWYASKASVYELSVDGSNGFRKVFDVMGDQPLAEIFVNPDGTRIGYLNDVGQKKFIFIHESITGKLLHKIDATPVFLDCFASNIGWLPDGERLFFTLDTGDVHMTSEESYKKRGNYLLHQDGSGLVRLPDNFTHLPLEKGFWRATDSPPQFIGGLPDGTYIFKDVKTKKRAGEMLSFLYKTSPANQSQKEIPLRISAGLGWFKVSPAGQYLAFTEKISSKEGRYEWVEHLWVKDLSVGEEKRTFTMDNVPFKGYYLGVVGWMENL